MTEEPELPPLVLQVVPMAPPRPGPGLLKAATLTFGYWVVLIGGMLAVVFFAAFVFALAGKKDDVAIKPDDGTNEIARMPPTIRSALAWSFPAGYVCGLIYSVVVIRKVVGREWMHALGLTRLPPYHLVLGLIALPGFIILSDVLAGVVHPLDEAVYGALGFRELGDMGEALRAMFNDFHWSFAVLAIGVGPGLVEELWCRGFLGRGFIGRYGWLVGIGLSSAFFGMLHLWPPSYVIVTAAMGACLHFAYVTSRSLWVPIVMHFANNSFAALVVMNVVPAQEIEASVAANEAAAFALAAAVLLLCGLAMWHARWAWPNETRGRLLPLEDSSHELGSASPNAFLAVLAAVSCGGLIWLLAK